MDGIHFFLLKSLGKIGKIKEKLLWRLYMLDFIRIACAVPPVQVGDVTKNTDDICRYIKAADEAKADVLVLPELALTGYTCADLFFQWHMERSAMAGLQRIIDFCGEHPRLTVAVGIGLTICGQMYNCCAIVSGGVLRGIVPKTFIPNYNEFYEYRWFSSSSDLTVDTVSMKELGLRGDYCVPVGKDLIFTIGDGAKLGAEICEDLWTPLPPSTLACLNGAEVIVNLSASNETVGKREYRRNLVKNQSSRCNCVYAYCSSGSTESTTDVVFSGHSMITQDGYMLAENQNLIDTDYMIVQDADLGAIRAERKRNKSVRDCTSVYGVLEPMRYVDCECQSLRSDGALYQVEKMPFVPQSQGDRRERCMDIFQIQVSGLKRRLDAIGTNAVIGVSGGLDSTLALLVTAEAMRQLGRPATDVYGLTMPCFGTTDRTYRNALRLMEKLGISQKEINIRQSVLAHFRDIGHDPQVTDGTYENAQARERTQVLMDYASIVNGIVIGTGDLSELALGWCTYNGDHMSMYSVNGTIPKTLMQEMIRAIADTPAFAGVREILGDILDTPISPELLPPDDSGKIAQQTEDLVGPYVLHDFFLYYMLRYGAEPAKIYLLACRVFADEYAPDTIKKWLRVFYRRFFSQQFKRSCQPDGVKVGNICVSPRGDWKMPSEASCRTWMEQIDKL